jgi:hypothetical protein
VGDLALLILPSVSARAETAKANVPNVGCKEFHFFCVVEKKLKHEALGCCVGKKSAVKFKCCNNVSIIVCQFNSCCAVQYACI